MAIVKQITEMTKILGSIAASVLANQCVVHEAPGNRNKVIWILSTPTYSLVLFFSGIASSVPVSSCPWSGVFVMQHFPQDDLAIIQKYPIKKGLRAFCDFLEGQRSQLDQPVHSNWISGLPQEPSEGKLWW